MVLYIGNQGTGDAFYDPDDQEHYATRFQCPQNMTLSTLYAYVNCHSEDQFKLAIYSDDSGLCDALLGETAAIGGLGSVQWQSGALLSPVALTSGTWYWLAVFTNGFTSGNGSVVYYDSFGVPAYYEDFCWWASWPDFEDPFNGFQESASSEWCIYGSDVLTILADTLTLAGSAESITDIGGTRTVVADILALASSAETMTLFAATYISVNTLALAGVAESITPVGGPISVLFNTVALAGTAESIAIMTDQTIIIDVLILAGSAELITVLGGTRTILVDVLALASSASNTFVSFVIQVNTIGLTGVVNDITPVGGATSTTVNTIALAGLAILMGPKRDALGTLDLGYLRGGNHEIEIYGSPLIPPQIWAARVNDAIITRGERDIIFDGGTGTAFALIEAKQEVWVGTSVGTKNMGRLRIRSITSGDGGVTGTLSVAQYPWWLADDDYLTFWLDYPIRPQFPYLAIDETFYKDKDLTYGDQNEEPTPVVVAGTHRADFLGSGGSTVFNIDASESYAMFPPGPSDPKSLISTYALEMIPSAGATPSIGASTGIGTITFTTTGQWWGKYTITDTNGKTQVSYRCYIICSTDPSDADYPLLSFENFRLNGSWDQGGWVTSFSAHEDATLADIPDETLMIIWAKTKYASTERVITLLPEDVTTIMAGYMTRAVADTDLDSGLSRVDFTVETPEAMLQRFNFSVSLESVEDLPDTWYEYEEWLTIGRSIHHLWKHHSTIFEVADVIGLMDNRDPRAYAEFEAGDLYSMADGFASDRGIRAHVVSDKGGRIHLTYDLQLLTDEERAQYKKVMDITTDDRRGNLGVDSRFINEYAFVKTSGFSWDKSFRTDESGNRVPDAEPLCASAPGSIPDDEGSSVYVKDRQTFRDQEHCNEIAGRVFAKHNATYPNVPVAFHGNYIGALDIAYPLWYTVSLQAGDTARGIVWTSKKLACRTVAVQYDGDQGTALIQANFEAEEDSITGVPAFCMDVQPDPWGPPDIPDPGEELPDALMTGGSAYYKSAMEQAWELRSTDSMEDMIQDPWWRDTTGSDSPDYAIVWYCGDGYIERSIDALQTTPVDVTPSTDPPNIEEDDPAPTATSVTYAFLEPGWVYSEEFICIARWQNASSKWRSWLTYTDDNGATWSWEAMVVDAGEISIDSFGPIQAINGVDIGTLGGWDPEWPEKTVAVMSETKVVLSGTFANDQAHTQYRLCSADISGETITEGSWVNVDDLEWNTPKVSAFVKMTSTNVLCIYMKDVLSNAIWDMTLKAAVLGPGNSINVGPGISWGDEYEELPEPPGDDRRGVYDNVDVCRMTDSMAVAGFCDYAYFYITLINVSGNVCSFMSPTDHAIGPVNFGTEFYFCRLTDSTFILAHQGNLPNNYNCFVRVGTISGNVITLGDPYNCNFNTGRGANNISCCKLTDDRFVAVWGEGRDSSQDVRAIQGEVVNGDEIELGVSSVAYSGLGSSYTNNINVDRLTDDYFIIHYLPGGSDPSDSFRIGYAYRDDVYRSIWFYDGVGPWANEAGATCWNAFVQTITPSKAIMWRIEDGDGPYLYQGSAYIINISLPSTLGVKALGLSMGQYNADQVYVTACDGNILKLLVYDLPSLAFLASYSLGSATFAELAAGTWSAYPLVLFDTDDVVYVYGRMEDPGGLGISQLVKSISAGASFTQIVGDWGTHHCGSLLVEADQYLHAIRNTGTGAKLYNGLAAALTLKSTLPFPHEVAPHGMDLDYYTGAVYACADTGNSIMVAKAMPPWLTWEDMTYDHGVASGVRSILLL